MAQTKATDLRANTSDELKARLIELKKEQFNLRFKAASGELESPAQMRVVRRDIARIKTVLGEKSAEANKA